MQFQYLLLFLVHFQCSQTLESKISKTIKVRGKAFVCLFNIQYEHDTCFQNSTVSCSPNKRRRRIARNVELKLIDGTEIIIKKLRMSRKKDKIMRCEIKSSAGPTLGDPLFIERRPVVCDAGSCFQVKMNPAIIQSVCLNTSVSSSTFEFNRKLFSYKGKVPPRSSLFESEDGTQAIFTCSRGKALYGSIPMEDGALYIEQRNSRSINDQIAVFLPESDILPDVVVSDILDEHSKSTTSKSNENFLRQGSSDNTTLARYSIKFYYTPQFAADTDDIPTFLDSALAIVNQGYINSKIPLEAYSLCSEQANIADQDFAHDMLDAFKNMKGSVENLRGGADVAALLVKHMKDAGGIAYPNTVNSGLTVSVTVKSYILGYYTLGHEIGHNIGLYHDPANSNNPIYPYGHGHLIQAGASSTGKRTILAYSAAGHRTRINYYSNPAIINSETKTPMGVEGVSNNAAVLLRNRFVLQNIEDGTVCDGTSLPSGLACPAIDVNTQDRRDSETLKNIRSMKECSNKCRGKTTCKFWSWHHKDAGDWAFDCVLMSGYGRTNSDGNVISGAKNCNRGGYIVSGISTAQVEATSGSTLWIDRHYFITQMPQELVGSTLFKPTHYVDKSTIEVFSPHKVTIYVGVYEPRDGGLIEILPAQGWILRDGWFVEWNGGAGQRLHKIWSKQIDAGKTISFTTSKNRMTFAIFISEETVDREWSGWSDWSACSATCGLAIRTRKRTCSSPVTSDDGVDCPGPKEEVEECSLPSCGPTLGDHLFTERRPVVCDAGSCFQVKMNPAVIQSVCLNTSVSSSTFEFNRKLFSYKGKVPPRSSLFESEDGTQAIFTCSHGKALYGSIPMKDGALYIEQRNSRSNNDQIAVFLPASDILPDQVVSDILDENSKTTTSESNEKLLRQGSSDNTTLARYSIKFYYTPQFAADTNDIPTFLDNALAVVNQGYINSRVPLEAYSLCSEQANINDPDSGSIMLNAFRNMKGSVENLRGGADVAALLVKDLTDAGGIAYFDTVNSGLTVSVTVKSNVLGYYTLGHEIGHNIGLAHDPANDDNDIYPHGHGHLIQAGASSTGKRTILAYGAAGHRTRINYYSNPAIINSETKTPMGVEGVSNNAAVLLRNRFVLQNIGNGNECDGTSLPTGITNPAPFSCNVIDGPAEGESCVFPFAWSGKIYYECAFEPSMGDTYPWCSTNVDASGTHISGGGHWGKCDPDTCKVPSPHTNPAPSSCNVIDGPAKGESCVFPFAWSGKIYYECAYEPSMGDTFPWCSTNVDASGIHISGGGHWGKCDPDTCKVPSPHTNPPASSCNVIDGPAEGESCVFPFAWSGKIYYECAYEPSMGDTFPWCSTNVDASGIHISGGGHWGKCDPETCKVPSPHTNPPSSSCNVIDGPAEGESCVFPFTWSGKTYNECAFEPSMGDTFPWCSTNVDTSGIHISGGGHWGKCDPDTCKVPSPHTNPAPSSCNVIDGPAEGESCVFPFTWSGKTYSECAFEPSMGDTFPWCSTNVDASGNHVSGGGHWGKCDPDTCSVPSINPPPSSNSCKCGLAKRHSRIVGGVETEVNEYPWLVGLVTPGSDRPFCGGTLINSKWVLTAAHCTAGSDSSSIQVVVGEHNVLTTSESQSIKRSVIQIVDHPSYNSALTDYDYSLLELSSAINFSLHPHVRPACLPDVSNTGEEPDSGLAGTNSVVAGWGTTSSGGQTSSYAQEVEVLIYSGHQCRSSYPQGQITSRMICAGFSAGGKDSCQGDSGGPLVHSFGSGVVPGENYVLTGVVSWGYGCALPGRPGVYAKVSYVLPWVLRNADSGEWCPRM